MDVECALCGATADGGADRAEAIAPLGWSADVVGTGDARRRRWVCVACTRRNVRSIEGKLDHEWW